MRKRNRRRAPALPSPLLLTLLCDATRPASASYQQRELLCAYEALDAITKDADPLPDHWRALADAVEIARELHRMGALPQDAYADINGAVGGLAIAGARTQETGKAIRIPGAYLEHVVCCLQWYEAALRDLPERTIVTAVIALARRNAGLRNRQIAHNQAVVTV